MPELHTSNTDNEGAPRAGAPISQFWDGVLKALPAAVIGLTIAAYQFFGASHDGQTDLKRRVEALEKRAETNAANIAENTKLMQQNSIRIAEISVIQQSALTALADIKAEQRELKLQLQK